MRTVVASVAVLLATVLIVSPAEAQFCAGAPSFRDRPFQVGVSAVFTEGAQGVGGEFAAGGQSLFAGGGVSVLNFGDLDSTSTNVSGFVGADLVTSQTQRVFVCPAALISFGVGPDFGAVDVSTMTLEGGGSVGVIAAETTTLMVIPAFGLAAIYNRVTVGLGSLDTAESDAAGRASVAVGFVFNRNVGITPAISIPFSAGNSDPIFTIRLTFNFGR